ncbi:MAG: von Willebrand factor type A domain-containing protein [Planctomycetes bacterium]|nr:von Willebrand factor type A domain-containing protein [Planctomycetota bacterium]
MSDSFHAEDPQLTAYVLGELSAAETAAVERFLTESAAARQTVAEIRKLTGLLAEQFALEPTAALLPSQRAKVLAATRKSVPAVSAVVAARPGSAATAVAACLIVVAVGALIVFNGSPAEESKIASNQSKSTSANGQQGQREELAANVRNTNGRIPSSETLEFERLLKKLERPALHNPKNFSRVIVERIQLGPNKKPVVSGKGPRQSLSLLNVPGQRNQQGQRGVNLSSLSLKQPGYPRPTLGFVVPGRPIFQRSSGRVASQLAGNWGTKNFVPAYNDPTSALGTNASYDSGLRLIPGRFGNQNSFLAGLATLEESFKSSERYYDFSYSAGFPKKTTKFSLGEKRKRKPDGDTPISGRRPITFFKATDVLTIKLGVAKQFGHWAKQNPNREIVLLRVKKRVSEKLSQLAVKIRVDEKAGKKLTLLEGRLAVGKLIVAELADLDVDGDGRADFSREAYDTIVENSFRIPLADPLSTFSIDVDTASFSNVRRFIAHGQLPPRNAVRVEELLNYFSYDYDQPQGNEPFSVNLEVGPCPWNPKHRLLRIGLQGREIAHDKRPASNLVFLIDVSGSMSSAQKLPLVKTALEMLVNQMTAKDRISIVTYANTAKLVLEPTSGDQKDKIITAIHTLVAQGSTNGAAGIQMAYAQAKKHLLTKDGGANRVILCTDGDLNVGISSDNELVKLIEKKRDESRVFLSVFGFGTGNLKASKLEKLADKGNGHYAYIDGPGEAKKVFVEEMTGMLYTIAKDVKIQVEFNPTQVGSYRLIGYENRMLAAQDFNDDKKDAGEIGAGHTVTALYEIIPVEQMKKKQPVDALKYQTRVQAAKNKPLTQELLTVKLRYKQPNGDKSVKREFSLTDKKEKNARPSLDFEWASAVAMYGLLLRDSKYAGQANLDLVRELAAASRGADPNGHRKQFLKMVYKTRALVARKLGQPIPAPRRFEAGPLNGK